MAFVGREKWDLRGYPVADDLFERERVDGSKVAGAVVPEGLAVELVAAALGDGVDHAAGGAAVLGGIVGRVDLEFLDGGFAGGVADAGAAALFAEERLVVVGAVDRVVVEQAGNAAETYQTKAAIRHRAGRAQRESRPASAVDGEIVDRGVVDVGAEVRAIGGDNGELGGGDDGFGHGLDAERGIYRRDSANFHGDIGDFEGAKAGAGDLERILAGLKVDEHVTAAAIRNAAGAAARAEVTAADDRVRHYSAGLIRDGASDGAIGCRLRVRGGNRHGHEK